MYRIHHAWSNMRHGMACYGTGCITELQNTVVICTVFTAHGLTWHGIACLWYTVYYRFTEYYDDLYRIDRALSNMAWYRML